MNIKPDHSNPTKNPTELNTQISPVLPYAALSISVLSLGFSAIFVRWADAPGTVTSFYRMAVSVAILAPLFYRRVRSQGRISRDGLRFAMIAGLFFAADLAFWSTGVVLSEATNPTLLANTAPLWVGLGAMLLFREKLGPRFWGGLILALIGAGVILGFDSFRNINFGIGSILGLIAGFFYAGYFLITQRGRESLDALTYFWPAALTSSLCLLAASLYLKQPLAGYSTPTYLNFLAIGLISQVAGYLAMNFAQGFLPASIVSVTLLGQPVVTAILAGPLLGERLSAWQIGGGLAVLAGVYVVHTSRQPARS